MRFTDIPRIAKPRYSIQVGLDLLEESVERYLKRGLVLEPDFQRKHIWTEEQQSAYVEFLLRDGPSGRDINFNHPKWGHGQAKPGEFVLVDGLQRLTACRRFLAGEIPAYRSRIREFGDELPTSLTLTFNVADLPTRADVLRWYIAINAGGTVHPKSEIERVERLLADELCRMRVEADDCDSPSVPAFR
jgi:hypothetical protein